MEEYDNKNYNSKTKVRNKNLHICPLHGPGHDMNLCKVMQAQAKSMNLTWSTASVSGACCIRFQGAKNCPAEVQELNSLLANVVQWVLNQNKRAKTVATHDCVSEGDPENFNLKSLSIG